MRAIWFVGRAELRQRWGSVIVLTLLVGLIGAVVLASLAGARRTSTAFARFKDETRAADLTVFVPAINDATLAELRAVPGVKTIGVARQFTATTEGNLASAGGALDDRIGRTVDRPRVLEGRRPRSTRAHEVAVPQVFARATGTRVGDALTIHGFTQAQIQTLLDGGDFEAPEGPKVRLRVVGITRVPGDLSLEGNTGGVIFFTEAFSRRYADQIGSFSGLVLRVRTTGGDATRRFVEIARARTAPLGQPGEFQVQPTSEFGSAVQEATDVVANGLLVFALVAAFAGLVVVAVVIRRFVDVSASVLPALRGLGVSRRSRALALAFPVVPILIGGAVLAVVGAWLASPLFPLGLARQAEPHLGLDIDVHALGVGFLVVLAVVGALGLWSASSVVRASTPSVARQRLRPSRASSASVAAGCSPPVTIGVAMALDPGRDWSTRPMRPALAGAVIAVLGIVAVGVMVASLDRLRQTPRAYGYNWDAHLVVKEPNRQDEFANCDPIRTPVVADRAVAAAADTCTSSVEVEGYSVAAVGFTALKGDIGPTVLAGRAPRAPDEVALATKTIGEIDVAIGDRVRIAGPGGDGRYRVVGRVVMPLFAASGTDDVDLQAVADGAVFTGVGLQPLTDRDATAGRVLVRWRPGADLVAARARLAALPGGVRKPLGPLVPLEVDRLEQLHILPWLLSAFLALIGLLGVGYGVVTAVHGRRRDLAVLKTLGFRRRQIATTVGTQATVFGVIGLVIGIPVGVIVGRAAWNAVAENAGLAAVPSVPVLAIVVGSVLTLIVVNVVAWIPAQRAARVRPAIVLRSE